MPKREKDSSLYAQGPLEPVHIFAKHGFTYFLNSVLESCAKPTCIFTIIQPTCCIIKNTIAKSD